MYLSHHSQAFFHCCPLLFCLAGFASLFLFGWALLLTTACTNPLLLFFSILSHRAPDPTGNPIPLSAPHPTGHLIPPGILSHRALIPLLTSSHFACHPTVNLIPPGILSHRASYPTKRTSSRCACHLTVHLIPLSIFIPARVIPLCMSSHRASYPTKHLIPPGILSHISPSALQFLSHRTILCALILILV